MAEVGTGTTSSDLNARAITLAQRLASNCWDIIAFAQYVDGQGANGLGQAGFSTADAATFQAAVDYMKTIAEIFQGNGTQAVAFNFSNAIAEFVGPNPGND